MNFKNLLFAFIIPIEFASAQNKIIHVNHATGTANVVIPLYTLTSGNVSLPISLEYSASGIRVNDVEGTAGMGWNISAGGAITRELRGLPDDCVADVLGNSKLGWMSSNNLSSGLISLFTISNDNNTATCSDESTDINYINAYLPNNNYDTEPDIFNVQAPGLSCKLIYDRQNNQFRTIPYQDLQISYVMGSNGITSFSLKNDKGLTYVFSAIEPAFKRATTINTSPQFLTTDYNQYKGTFTTTPGVAYGYYVADANGFPFFQYANTQGSYYYSGGINFAAAWDLTSINDVSGNSVNITYVAGIKKGYISPVSVFIGGSTTATSLYTVAGNSTPNLISQVSSGYLTFGFINLNFAWQTNTTTQKSFLSSISGAGRNFQFTYNNVAYSGNSNNFNRYFLNNVVDPGCGTPFNYAFNYFNPAALPDSTSSAIDYWGYYNGQTNNTNLYPDIKINPSNSGYSTYANPESVVFMPNGSVSSSYASTYSYEISGSNRTTSTLTNAPLNNTVISDTHQSGPSNTESYNLSDANFEADQTSSFNNYNTPNVTGTLTQVSYGNGGYTSLSYEPNDYYDPLLQAVVAGGGIRIKQITDGEITAANPNANGFPPGVTSYSYSDPSTGYSSGKPVSLPVFAFTTPYTGTATGSAQWIASTITSYSDLSSEDHTIYYGTVTEALPGTGSITHQFSTPATNNSPSIIAPLLPWQPTTIYVGRNQNNDNSCPSIGLLTNSINTYPFPPNTNYDFERGLPLKDIQYNDLGNEVSETDYSYSTPTPNIITAFKYDYNNQISASNFSALNYAKYVVYASTGPLTTQIYNKIFDLSSTTSFKPTTTNYSYASSQHRLPTTVAVINSDGSTDATITQYVKDYLIPQSATPGDNFIAALQNLQSNNINAPIEKYTQYTPGGTGQTAVTTNAQLLKYTIFTLTNRSFNTAKPVQKSNFSIANGISNFQKSSVSGSYTFLSDPNYKVYENDFAYDYTGALLSNDDGYKHSRTVLINHINTMPAVVIDNAKFDEIGFADFDNNDAVSDFNFTGTYSNNYTGRALNGMNLSSGAAVTKTITRNILAKNYIFSVWVNSGVPGAFSITITGTGSGGNVTNNGSSSFIKSTIPNTSTGWQYCEAIISLSGITSPTFTITATTNQNIVIDDVLCYPDASEVNTFSYDPLTGFKIAETNTNGVSTYITNDAYGRATYVFDQDKNVVNRSTYSSTNNIQNLIGIANSNNAGLNFLPLAFTSSVSGRAVTFTNTSFATPCIAGPSITWNFGDGSTVTSIGSTPVVHTYSAAGSYSVTMSFTSGTAINAANTVKVQ